MLSSLQSVCLVVTFWFTGSATACADVLYDFAGSLSFFPGTVGFRYIAPDFVTGDVSIPAGDLASCEFSGTVQGPCFAVNFFPSGPDNPMHEPELTFQTDPFGDVGTFFFYFPLGSSFESFGTLTTDPLLGNQGTLKISAIPEPSSGLLALSIAVLYAARLRPRVYRGQLGLQNSAVCSVVVHPKNAQPGSPMKGNERFSGKKRHT